MKSGTGTLIFPFVPLWVVRRILDILRWTFIVLAIFLSLSCFAQGAPVSAVALASAAITFKFVSEPWRVFKKQVPVLAVIYSCALVLMVGGTVGLILNRREYLVREANEERIAAKAAAEAAAAKDLHYRKSIVGAVFAPLSPDDALGGRMRASNKMLGCAVCIALFDQLEYLAFNLS
jgi:hypothetical protein